MKNPFFSIILPTYNRGKLIPKAILSVINQTFTNWELIIVDDGSTDETKKTIESFDDNRIKYLYQENQERSIARNTGINNSAGQFICFLDSDDYYLENHLHVLYEDISEQNFPVSFFYVLRAFESNNEITYPPLNKIKVRNNIELIFNIMIATPQACIHKDILQKHKFNPEFKIGEDIELWSRVLIEYPLEKVNKYTVITKNHEENSVNFSSGNFFIENLKVVKYIFKNKKISSYISIKQKYISISNCYFGIARYYILKNKKSKAIYNLLKSIVYFPFHKQNMYRLKLIIKTLI